MPIMGAKEIQQHRMKWIEELVRRCELQINAALCEGRTFLIFGVSQSENPAPVFAELFDDVRAIVLRNMSAAGLTNPTIAMELEPAPSTAQDRELEAIAKVLGTHREAPLGVRNYRISWDAQVDLAPPERGVDGLPVGKVSVH